MYGITLPDDSLDWTELTPICCNCRRERTPSGEWQEHVAAPGERLTHGICPACLHALYPDYAELVEAG